MANIAAAAPEIRVYGTNIKMTAYLRGRCEAYYQHSKIYTHMNACMSCLYSN